LNKKEDLYKIALKYDIKVKSQKDLENERLEEEKKINEEIEIYRQNKLEMERIEKEKYETRMKQISNEISPVSSPEIIRKSSNKKIEKQDRSLSNSPDLKRCRTSNKKIKKEKKENEIEIEIENEKENELHNFTLNEIEKEQPKHKKRLTIVDSEKCDNNDQKLDNTLIDIYNKKRMSYIPVKKIDENDYEFGTQRINIIIDGETIRGKTFFL